MMALSVAIDAFRLVTDPRTSSAIYVSELVKSLSASPEVQKLYLLLPRRPGHDFIYDDLIRLEKVECIYPHHDVFPERGLVGQVNWIQWVILRLVQARLRSIDCYIAPYHHPPIFLPKRIRVVTVIHDLCGLRADCGYLKTKKGFYRHAFLFLMASMRSSVLIPISKYTKGQLEKQFPFLSGRVSNVVYNGVNCHPVSDLLLSQTLKRFALDRKRYFLGFGSPGPRKGLDLILGAYKLYKKRAGSALLVLIVAGQYRTSVQQTIRTEGVTDVVTVSEIEANERDALYRGALALLFPSRCEGFGYPVVEAMRQGCPPIAWHEGPASEIVDTVLPLLTKLDVDEIVMQMEIFEKLDPGARVELSQHLFQRSLLFTGERFGYEFLESLKGVTQSC
jgi:glycosyltransferase involved in cell wall biosynthesis